ncbi:universal stress protein [Candidatus Bipolaricaulota bacterium]|nr:universal stress protein [Candidatus Bipolaricaulota bacterium]
MNEEQLKKPSEELGYGDVLISIANPETAKQLVTLAHHLTTHQTTFHIVNVTRKGSFLEEERSWRKGSELVMDTTHYAQRLGRVAKPVTATSSSVPEGILNSAEGVEADLILMGWFGRITPVSVRRSSVVNKVLHKAPCDVGVLKSRKNLGNVKKILLPVGPNKLKPKRLAVFDRLLKQSKAKGDMIHVLTPDTSNENAEEMASERLNEAQEMLTGDVATRVIQANSVLRGLLRGSETADLIVIGPGREWVFNRFLFGRTADNLTNRVESSVLMFKGSEHKMVAWSKGLLKALVDLAKRPFR